MSLVAYYPFVTSRISGQGKRIGPVFLCIRLSVCLSDSQRSQYMYMCLSARVCLSAQNDFGLRGREVRQRWGVFIAGLKLKWLDGPPDIFVINSWSTVATIKLVHHASKTVKKCLTSPRELILGGIILLNHTIAFQMVFLENLTSSVSTGRGLITEKSKKKNPLKTLILYFKLGKVMGRISAVRLTGHHYYFLQHPKVSFLELNMVLVVSSSITYTFLKKTNRLLKWDFSIISCN